MLVVMPDAGLSCEQSNITEGKNEIYSGNSQKMVRKWSRHDQEIVRKWSRNGQEMVKTWSEIGLKMIGYGLEWSGYNQFLITFSQLEPRELNQLNSINNEFGPLYQVHLVQFTSPTVNTEQYSCLEKGAYCPRRKASW